MLQPVGQQSRVLHCVTNATSIEKSEDWKCCTTWGREWGGSGYLLHERGVHGIVVLAGLADEERVGGGVSDEPSVGQLLNDIQVSRVHGEHGHGGQLRQLGGLLDGSCNGRRGEDEVYLN